jgi:RND family efflux transporter MFP subunit
VLFTIESHAFESALAHARARLREAQAQLEATVMSVRHSTQLVKEGALRPVQLENDVRANDAALAAVESATLDVETALRNLRLTRVTTPIGGVAAMADVQIGDLVGPTTLLTTVSQVDPIRAYFPVHEQEYLTLARRLTFTPRGTLPGASAPLRLLLADGQAYPYAGSFLAADREVDQATATIRVAAVFANPGDVLRPGQRVRVQANTGTIVRAVVVPERAVAELQGVHRVWVVRPDNRV